MYVNDFIDEINQVGLPVRLPIAGCYPNVRDSTLSASHHQTLYSVRWWIAFTMIPASSPLR
ncbi:hypothetical protein B6254_2492 (plasmid) [Weissella cibaria]|uniref:Uncharacterized protein n=1 Tax=Weissella cibaria TaxID=137591 RepID=A0A2S1KUZ5_9LACO|nr:hypothetical protein B6254_2492 [Weissella cibaria]